MSHIRKTWKKLSVSSSLFASNKQIFLLGMFNVRIGKSHAVSDGIIGKHGSEHLNGNGLRVLNLQPHHLIITNNIFPTWENYDHLVPLTIKALAAQPCHHPTQRQDRQDVTIIRNIRGAGCCTDYGLIQSLQIKVRLALQKHARANRFNCAPFPEAQILEMRNGLVSTLNIIPVILITLVVRPSPRSGTPLPLPTRNHH